MFHAGGDYSPPMWNPIVYEDDTSKIRPERNVHVKVEFVSTWTCSFVDDVIKLMSNIQNAATSLLILVFFYKNLKLNYELPNCPTSY